jgi:hypothetical protein
MYIAVDAAIIRVMAERDEGALERAEGFFKKVLERIGSSVDEKLASSADRLPAHVVGALAATIERTIEEQIRPDERGVRRLAPDRFDVMLTYEQNAGLVDEDRRALAHELAATAYEYVVNHRYATLGRIYVEVGCDLFAEKPLVDASFSPAPGESAEGAAREVRPTAAGEVKTERSSESSYLLIGPGGKPVVRVEILPGGEPVTVGRGAGNRLLIDHASVSKFHATISLAKDNTLVLSDLGSTNGTYVNRESAPLSGACAISPGDTIVFGEVPYIIRKI